MGQQQPDEDHTAQWLAERERGFEAIAHPDNDPLAQGDREDALTDWLEDYGIEDAWKLAEPLAAGRVKTETLDSLMNCWRDDKTEMREMGIRWLSLSFEVMGMIRQWIRRRRANIYAGSVDEVLLPYGSGSTAKSRYS